MRLLPMGDAAVLAELDDEDAVLPLAEVLRGEPAPGVLDIVPAERSVLVRFDPAHCEPPAIARWLRRAGARAVAERRAPGPLLELSVRYDGEDLDEVARLTGLSPEAVVAAHAGQEWLVAFRGFAPGFGYLRGGPPVLAVPRRDEPRARVPAGSVALAAGYSGVYPRAAPGGWQLIGRTDAVLWDADRDPPALLQPGTRVRFRSL